MEQVLCDLYEVTFNDVKRLPTGNIVVHFQDSDDVIELGPDCHVVVGEPYLEALSRYGRGFKTKTLIKKNCTWLGRDISAKLKNGIGSNKGFRLTKID